MRGDEDMNSIMSELGSGKKMSQGQSTSSSAQRMRLVPELKGYGENERTCPDSRKEGKIWNPYIHISIGNDNFQTSQNIMLSPPTCPQVEIIRRRTYEKFKQKFHSAFKYIAGNSQIETQKEEKKKNKKRDGEDVNSLWIKIPSHSILERFYFACKVDETFQVINTRQNKKIGELPLHGNISQIANLIALASNQGIFMDPILLSSTNNRSGDLLKNEIQFQFTREWRKATKGKDLDKVKEFFTSKPFQRRCVKIARMVKELASEAEAEVLRDVRKRANDTLTNSTKKASKKGIPKLTLEAKKDDDEVTEFYTLALSGQSFRISMPHFEKLQHLFDRTNKSSGSLQEHQNSFLCSLFSLLARYDQLEGAGLQSSLNGNVFDVLLRHFNCNLECFASPFNSRYERFCSAFPDTDCDFGSLGSFFNTNFQSLMKNGACFQANPPFASDFISAMCKKMEDLLTDDSIKAPFMFIVFVPAWTESKGWKLLNSATSLVHHLFLSQKDDPHYYCEGTQHRRLKERYRIASFDTSVFFLQNAAAKAKWPITETTLSELKQAFGSNPDEISIEEELKIESAAVQTTQPKKTLNNESPKEKPTRPLVDNDKKKSASGKKKRKQKPKPNEKKKKKAKKNFADDNDTQLAILSSLLSNKK